MTQDLRGIREYYDHASSTYDLTRKLCLLGRSAGVRLLDTQPGHHVLEIGGGTGHNIPPITDTLGQGTLTLLDFSIQSLIVARRKASCAHRDVRLIAADARRLPFHENAYDRILFSYSLSLLPDPMSVLRSAIHLLKPTGSMVIADFGPMQGWGPFRTAILWWLRRHSVIPVSSLVESIPPGPHVQLTYRELGYTMLARIGASVALP